MTMFKENYRRMNEGLHPSSQAVENVMARAGKRRMPRLLRPACIAATACLICVMGLPVLASNSNEFYQFMYSVSPGAAQLLMPVEKSCEDNGIRMEVISAEVKGNSAAIYISMEDLTGDRIDSTIDLFDSYSINRPFSGVSGCTLEEFDEETGKAVFFIQIQEYGDRNIAGDKLTFKVSRFLSGKEVYEDIELTVDLKAASAEPSVRELAIPRGFMEDNYQGIEDFDWDMPTIMGYSGMDFDSDMRKSGRLKALLPGEPIEGFPVAGMEITAIGFIDGRLHVQTSADNVRENDNHGFFHLKDKNGGQTDELYGFSCNETDADGTITTYAEHVFDISKDEIENYRLCGSFFTAGGMTEGNWQVTFPVEDVEQLTIDN